MTQGQFFSGVQQAWIQFSLSETDCLTMAEEPGLLHYWLVIGGWEEEIDLCIS